MTFAKDIKFVYVDHVDIFVGFSLGYFIIISRNLGIQENLKPASDSPKGMFTIESWLVNRDPYFMAYYNPYITGYNPLYKTTNRIQPGFWTLLN